MIFNHRMPSWLRTAYRYDSLGGICYGIFYGLTISFLFIIACKIGANPNQMALLSSSAYIGALFSIWWAYISRKRPKMVFTVRTKTLARLLFLLMFCVTKPTYYVLLVIAYWFLEFGGTPTYIRVIEEIYPQEDRGKALGYVRVELALAAIIFSYLGGWLLDKISYRVVFPLGAVVGVLALLFFRQIPLQEEKVKKERRHFSLLYLIRLLKRNLLFRQFSISIMLLGSGFLISLPLYPIFLVDN